MPYRERKEDRGGPGPEAGSVGEPLYTDVVAALREAGRNMDVVVGGRYGLGNEIHAVDGGRDI